MVNKDYQTDGRTRPIAVPCLPTRSVTGKALTRCRTDHFSLFEVFNSGLVSGRPIPLSRLVTYVSRHRFYHLRHLKKHGDKCVPRTNKKLCYHRRTARYAVSQNQIVGQYNKSTTNRSDGVRGLQLTDL